MKSIFFLMLMVASFTMACGGATPAAETTAPTEASATEEVAAEETPVEAEKSKTPVNPKATETGADPTTSKLDEEKKFDMATTIRAYNKDMTACYSLAIKDLTLSEEGFLVKSKFTIEADGSVAGVEIVEATQRFEEAEGCLIKIIAGMEFGAPPKGRVVEVVYPFKIRRK